MAPAIINSVMVVPGFFAVFVLSGASATWLDGFLVMRLQSSFEVVSFDCMTCRFFK